MQQLSKINQANLSPVISIEPGTHRVMFVSATGQGLAWCNKVEGDPALWLYKALAGHAMTEPPDRANPIIARMARAHLFQMMTFDPAMGREMLEENQFYKFSGLFDTYAGYGLAWEVVQNWGDHIKPWLGVHLAGPDGQPIRDCPAYRRHISLSDNQMFVPVVELWKK